MQLRYDISIIGMKAIDRALAGIERRVEVHNGRVGRAVGDGHSRGGRPGRGGPYRSPPATAGTDRTRAADSEGRARQRWEQRINAQRRRAQQQDIRHARTMQRQAQQAVQRNARTVVSTAAGSARRSARAIGSVARGALAVGGAYTIEAAMRRAVESDALSRQLATRAYRPGEGKSLNTWQAEFEGAATKAGAGGEGAAAVMGGMGQYMEATGDAAGALAMSQRMTDIATATGAKINDVGKVMGETMMVLDQRGIKGAAAMRELDRTLMVLAAQGEKGSIEFKNFAAEMGKLGAATDKFAAPQGVSALLGQFGALGQIAKQGGASSASQAATALMRLPSDMIKKSDYWARIGEGGKMYGSAKEAGGRGIDVYRRDNQGTRVGLKDPVELVAELIRRTGGDAKTVAGATNARSKKVVDALVGRARFLGGGDLEKGIAKMREKIADLARPWSETDVREKAGFSRQSTRMKLAQAMDGFGIAMRKMLPSLSKFAEKSNSIVGALDSLASGVNRVAEVLIDNPLKGIGAIIAAKVFADLAVAGIGNAARGALVSALSGAGASAAGGASAGRVGAAGAAGIGGGTAAAGIATVAGGAVLGGGMGADVARVLGADESTGRTIGQVAGAGYLGLTGAVGGLGAAGRYVGTQIGAAFGGRGTTIADELGMGTEQSAAEANAKFQQAAAKIIAASEKYGTTAAESSAKFQQAAQSIIDASNRLKAPTGNRPTQRGPSA